MIIKKYILVLTMLTSVCLLSGYSLFPNKGTDTVESLNEVPALPKPSSYISGIPVYDKFEDLAPLFKYQNDTTYIINFWATWCKPCIEELPFFESLNQKSANGKVKIILCSLDFPNQLEKKLVPFLEKKSIKSEVIVLLDSKYNDWIDKVSTEWSGAIPATIAYKGTESVFLEGKFEDEAHIKEFLLPIFKF